LGKKNKRKALNEKIQKNKVEIIEDLEKFKPADLRPPLLDSSESSLKSSIHSFTDPEILEDGFGCIQCTKTEMLRQGLQFDDSLFQEETEDNEQQENNSIIIYYCTINSIPWQEVKKNNKTKKNEQTQISEVPCYKTIFVGRTTTNSYFAP